MNRDNRQKEYLRSIEKGKSRCDRILASGEVLGHIRDYSTKHVLNQKINFIRETFPAMKFRVFKIFDGIKTCFALYGNYYDFYGVNE